MNLNDKHILVVDDEEVIRAVFKNELQKHGLTVHIASDIDEAATILKSNSIDAVITDIRLSDGSGLAILDLLRIKDPKSHRVIIMTGFSDIPDEEAYDKGAQAVLMKPFELKALLKVIKRVLTSLEDKWHNDKAWNSADLAIEERFADFEQAVQQSRVILGHGGMFLQISGRLPYVEDQVVFRIQFGSGEFNTIEGRGIVRWIRTETNKFGLPAGCGIEFLELGLNTRNKFIDYVRRVNPLAFIPKGKSLTGKKL